jgi:hypothetical protein
MTSHLRELGVPLADSLILDQQVRRRMGAPLLVPDLDTLRQGVAAGEIESFDDESLGALEAMARWNAEHGAAPASGRALGSSARAGPPPTRL